MAEARNNRLFGTDGIRGVAGEFPLDDPTVELIGASLVESLAGVLGRPPRLVLGRDTRLSGPRIEAALAQGARGAGGDVSRAGVITTPGVAFVTRYFGFDAGIVISASHNPYRDNGIKVFSPSGKKLEDEMERRIEADIEARAGSFPDAHTADYGGDAPDAHFRERYIDFLAGEVGRALSIEGVRLGLDCSNGAASEIAPAVFERLGATVSVICASPDGRNINEACGSLHPDKLQELVRARELDLGVAFDGDADRALFVDSEGRLVDGDQVLFILATHMKSQERLSGDLVVATVMSNMGLEICLKERGISLVRAQVGDRFVLEKLLALGAKLGGEQSGHLIFPDISLAGDGIITAIELLRAVVTAGRPLGQLASEMAQFPQVLLNVKVRSKPPLETVPEVWREIERVESELQGRGRLLVRYSGTENLARVMIEGEQQARIEEQANRLAEVIRQALG